MLQVPDEGLAGVAAAVGVVEGAEELADRAQGGDITAADPLAGAALGLPLPGDAGGARQRQSGARGAGACGDGGEPGGADGPEGREGIGPRGPPRPPAPDAPPCAPYGPCAPGTPRAPPGPVSPVGPPGRTEPPVSTTPAAPPALPTPPGLPIPPAPWAPPAPPAPPCTWAGGSLARPTHSSARPISQSLLGTTSPAGVKAILRSSAWLPESFRHSPLTMSTASAGVAANSRPA